MRIVLTNVFRKQLGVAPDLIKEKFRDRMKLFLVDMDNDILHNHGLRPPYSGLRSINIDSDWRVIYREIEKGEAVLLVAIGTHKQLYG